jgi:hypothetical protein
LAASCTALATIAAVALVTRGAHRRRGRDFPAFGAVVVLGVADLLERYDGPIELLHLITAVAARRVLATLAFIPATAIVCTATRVTTTRGVGRSEPDGQSKE